ncbi:GNAT family N-acetyltransferase [Cesiribacter sp. SM1]|uniref:GNAT family N-acetyltransferase n=1 Tax=Cesiribacter sp. SM1 TaxID=2861196 RepID=UPI001CD7E539|nr:GNAT family N-acetyltransferase [Cesiribacter sp. SM1]
MIEIIKADNTHFSTIRSIAFTTWPPTFGDILSPEQIEYMLDMMYSMPALMNQVYQKGHTFILAREEDSFLGFAAYEPNYQKQAKTKIHKIYVLPAAHGKGVGKALMGYIRELALKHNNPTLTLNVNRNNKAVQFYEKIGFEIVGREDIDIGNGFLMEDYIMDKQL